MNWSFFLQTLLGTKIWKNKEYHESEQIPQPVEEPAEVEKEEEEIIEEIKSLVETEEEPQPPKEEVVEEAAPLIPMEDTTDLLGLTEVNPKAAELEESNALALAIVQPGNDPLSSNRGLNEISGAGWELALVTSPSNNIGMVDTKLAGGFDKLLLDSLYEDNNARRHIQLQNAGYGYGGLAAVQNPFEQQQQQNDPFIMSNGIAAPPNVQMAVMQQQQQQQQMLQQNQQQSMMVPYQQPTQFLQQQMPQTNYANPFGDPFVMHPNTSTPQQGNHMLL
ncbi:hypothetical protein Pint_14017 [Pistacia integerrima]|uniref:Uncharacterized protein n=1 Tax=Pistacia integerrima TaxID=434235 RepID=A0ACC0YAA9_9ROSI|nr:hypothetical protein Pint_14017 [Pistacia integerrima]